MLISISGSPISLLHFNFRLLLVATFFHNLTSHYPLDLIVRPPISTMEAASDLQTSSSNNESNARLQPVTGKLTERLANSQQLGLNDLATANSILVSSKVDVPDMSVSMFSQLYAQMTQLGDAFNTTESSHLGSAFLLFCDQLIELFTCAMNNAIDTKSYTRLSLFISTYPSDFGHDQVVCHAIEQSDLTSVMTLVPHYSFWNPQPILGCILQHGTPEILDFFLSRSTKLTFLLVHQGQICPQSIRSVPKEIYPC